MSYVEEYTKAVQGLYVAYCDYAHNGGFKGKKKKELSWIPSKFHKYLCNTLQEFVERDTDKAFEILILNTPPQHGKSTTVTETFPSWYLMKHPDDNVIQVSYSDDLARKFGKKNLDKIKRNGHIFGIEIDKDKHASKNFLLSGHTGGMISVGYGSGITGNPANLIIIDDPVKNRVEADSALNRETKWNDYLDSIQSRIAPQGKIVLIMTRWHEDDLAGRLISHYPDRTTVINLPCECESEDDPLGREIGDALCPEIGKGNEWLADFKKALVSEEGARTWNALYQGRPSAKEGNLIKREWWRFYEEKDIQGVKFDEMLISIDATFKDGERNDFVAIEVWGKLGADFYLIDLVREHLDFVETINIIKYKRMQYRQIGATLIEDTANGTAIIRVLSSQMSGVIPVKADSSKEARVQAILFAIEARNVYLPKDRDFTWDFIEECAAFPNGKHDDMVDSMSQGLYRLIFSRRRGRRSGIIPHEVSFWERKPGEGKRNRLGKGDKVKVI